MFQFSGVSQWINIIAKQLTSPIPLIKDLFSFSIIKPSYRAYIDTRPTHVICIDKKPIASFSLLVGGYNTQNKISTLMVKNVLFTHSAGKNFKRSDCLVAVVVHFARRSWPSKHRLANISLWIPDTHHVWALRWSFTCSELLCRPSEPLSIEILII